MCAKKSEKNLETAERERDFRNVVFIMLVRFRLFCGSISYILLLVLKFIICDLTVI